jgi:hypothetical protein
MKITVKQINELIASTKFVLGKEGNKYVLKNGKTKWQLKGTLKANYETILKLAGVSQQDLIDENAITDDVKQLFKYAFDIVWGEYKDNVAKAKLIRFKSTDLNGIQGKINYDKRYSRFQTGETPFNRIWRSILRYQFQNHERDCNKLLEKFEKEMDIKQLVKG